MTTQKLSTLCIEKPWALPVDVVKGLINEGIEPEGTLEEAISKNKEKIGMYDMDIRNQWAWHFREAAKELPELQPVADNFLEYDRRILSDQKVIELVNKSYDLLKNTSKTLVLSETDIGAIDWYDDNAKDYFSYGRGGELFKKIPGVDVEKICERIRFINDKGGNRISVIVPFQEALKARKDNQDGDADLYKRLNRDFLFLIMRITIGISGKDLFGVRMF